MGYWWWRGLGASNRYWESWLVFSLSLSFGRSFHCCCQAHLLVLNTWFKIELYREVRLWRDTLVLFFSQFLTYPFIVYLRTVDFGVGRGTQASPIMWKDDFFCFCYALCLCLHSVMTLIMLLFSQLFGVIIFSVTVLVPGAIEQTASWMPSQRLCNSIPFLPELDVCAFHKTNPDSSNFSRKDVHLDFMTKFTFL